MSDHLRFLDFPLEIREIVYQELLCTWDMKHKRERAYLRTRYDNPTAILCTNKQLYNEAYDYLVKHNRFIRVNCEGISIRFHPLGRQILPVSEDPKKISQFKGYVAHVNWTANSGQMNDGSRKRYMVLGKQFPDILKCTDYHSITRWPIISMNIVMNPIPTQWQTASTKPATSLRPFQTNLLYIIPTLLHAFPGLTISGAVGRELADRIIHETAQPRWTDPIVALSDLLWFKHNNEQLGQEAYYLSTNTVIESGLQTIDYMRKSTAWDTLKCTGGPDFVNAVSALAFEFLVSRAQRALDAMERSQCRRNLVEKFGEYAEADLRESLAEPDLFGQDGANWKPSEQQVAIVMCMIAKRHRLLLDAQNRDFAIRSVERAFRVFPQNEMIQLEREAIGIWSTHVDRYLQDAGGLDSGLLMWQWWVQEEKYCDC
ncbi:hypothetical protein N0V90_011466 [Kalmusia sp. IMI 367209]|nr:hypothetical protein N0V90_011466 [Kalmusia sp. IMI 367209]